MGNQMFLSIKLALQNCSVPLYMKPLQSKEIYWYNNYGGHRENHFGIWYAGIFEDGKEGSFPKMINLRISTSIIPYEWIFIRTVIQFIMANLFLNVVGNSIF